VTAIVAVHSWRGGTGKSTVVARLGTTLAGRGLRVGMVDASLHAPGLHEALDIDVSSFRLCLWDYLRGVCEIEDARHDLSGLLPAPDGTLFLVPARTDVEAISLYAASGRYDAGLLHEGFHRLIGVLGLDVLLIDTHSGADHEALHAIASSDVDILVTRVGSAEQRSAGLAASISHQLGRMPPASLLVVNMLPPGHDPVPYGRCAAESYQLPVAAVLPRLPGPVGLRPGPDRLSPGIDALADRILLLGDATAQPTGRGGAVERRTTSDGASSTERGIRSGSSIASSSSRAASKPSS
jgi:septum site-determining protein MinD